MSNSLFRGFRRVIIILLLNPLKSELLTKQACRDELVVYSLFFFSNNLYVALLICIEHFFTNIELYTLYKLYIYTAVFGIQPTCNDDLFTATSCFEACVAEIRVWMFHNYLKLNYDNSELLVFHTRDSPHPVISNIMVGEEGVTPSSSRRNIGVVFDDTLTFETFINSVCKTSF